MHYYTHNCGEYATLTKFMTFEEKGIFVDFIDRYLTTGKPLDSQWVSIVKRMASEGAVENVLTLAFEEKDGCFYNADCEKKLADYAVMAEKNRRNAEKRSKKQQVEPVATQSQPSGNPLDALTINHKPITNKEEERVVERKTARAPMTKKLDADTLPDAWKDYCAQVRPDLDPQTVFTSFSFYYRSGNGAATLRSSKGWSQAWQNWVRREKAQKPAAKPGAPVHDKDGRLVNYMSVDFNQLDYHDGVNPDGSF